VFALFAGAAAIAAAVLLECDVCVAHLGAGGGKEKEDEAAAAVGVVKDCRGGDTACVVCNVGNVCATCAVCCVAGWAFISSSSRRRAVLHFTAATNRPVRMEEMWTAPSGEDGVGDVGDVGEDAGDGEDDGVSGGNGGGDVVAHGGSETVFESPGCCCCCCCLQKLMIRSWCELT